MTMFQDGRSRNVAFLAHCLLNQNAISDGTAVRPAGFPEMVSCWNTVWALSSCPARNSCA